MTNMLNAHCDLPTCEQPEIVPDSVPVVPSLLDEYRRVFEEFGAKFVRQEDGVNHKRDYYRGSEISGCIVIWPDCEHRIIVEIGKVELCGFLRLSDLPRFKAAIRAALETP